LGDVTHVVSLVVDMNAITLYSKPFNYNELTHNLNLRTHLKLEYNIKKLKYVQKN